MTEGFLPCTGGPYDGKQFQAGDEVPEGWRVTVGVPLFKGPVDFPTDREWRGVYVRRGEFLVWEGMK